MARHKNHGPNGLIASDDEDSGMSCRLILGYIFSIIMGIIGAFLGAYSAWFYDDGVFVIGSAVASGIVFFLGTALFAGPGRQFYNFINLQVLRTPSHQRVKTLGASAPFSFPLFVTVHRVQNIKGTEFLALLGKRNDSYVKIRAGRLADGNLLVMNNATMRTSVRTSGVFEEVFSFSISPTDDLIRFSVMDQDMSHDDEMAYADVEVDDIVKDGFPQNMVVNLTPLQRRLTAFGMRDCPKRSDAGAGTIIISCRPGAGFHMEQINKKMRAKHEGAIGYLQQTGAQLTEALNKDSQETGAGGFGSWIASPAPSLRQLDSRYDSQYGSTV